MWPTTCTVRPSRPLEWAAWRPWRRSDFSPPTRWKASQLNKTQIPWTRESHRQIRNAGFRTLPSLPSPRAGEAIDYLSPAWGKGREGAKQREFARATSIDHGLG